MKKFLIVLSALCLSLSACSSPAPETLSPSDAGATTPQTPANAGSVQNDGGGAVSFDGGNISATGAVTVDGNAATITSAGSYEISGNLDDGVLVVNTKGDVTLILNNAEIRSSTVSPLQIKDADSVVIQLADGSSNSLTGGSSQR